MSKINIGVLVSGGGSNLQALIDAVEKGEIEGKIALIISSNPEAYALERARKHSIEGIYIGKNNYPSLAERSNRILEILKERNIDLIVLAGYMNQLGTEIIQSFSNRIINIHPSLIPSFCGKGFYGQRVHQAALDYGVKITGATVHFVDEGMDTGPIILQEAVAVEVEDTVETLGAKVLAIEHKLLPQAVKLFAEDRLRVEGRKVAIV